MLDPMIDWHVNVLARTLYGMTPFGDDATREAIAAVVMNRCMAAQKYDTMERWGLTISDVCLKPDEFACWDADHPKRSAIIRAAPGDKEFMDCFLIAFRACHGFYKDETGGADTFAGTGELTDEDRPGEKTATIGEYEFYREMPNQG